MNTRSRRLSGYLVIFLGVIYGLWPLDLIPDIPLIGWIDDLGILGAALVYGLKLISKKKANNTIKDSR